MGPKLSEFSTDLESRPWLSPVSKTASWALVQVGSVKDQPVKKRPVGGIRAKGRPIIQAQTLRRNVGPA